MGVGVGINRFVHARGRLTTTLIAGALVVAACGGGEASDESVSSEPSSPTQPADSTDTTPATDSPPATDAVPTTDVAETSETDVTITSDDGVLEVFVPAGSGPADITIEQIDIPDVEVPAVGYELGPDGATYSEPVTLTFSLPADEWSPDGGVPVVVFASDSDDVPIATTSRDDDTVTVVANVDHFSQFYIFGGGRIVLLDPNPLRVPITGEASSQVSVPGIGEIGLGAESALWTFPPGFTLLRDRLSSVQSGSPGAIAHASVTCDSPGAGAGPYNVELEVSSDLRLPVFGDDTLFEVISNVMLEAAIECVEPIEPVEPIEQDCLFSSEDFAEYCLFPELVLPGVDPISLIVEIPEGMGTQRVILSLSGGEDPATEILIRFPMDGPPFAFFSDQFQPYEFNVPLSVPIFPTGNEFEITDLPIVVTDSETLLQVPAGTTSDGTAVPAAEVPLTGVTIEIGNQGAVTTSIFEPQTFWFF